MKDLVDAIGTRVKSPYFGYAMFAFLALNWEVLFVLLLSDSGAQERVAEFNKATNIRSLFFYPLIFGFLVAILSPWFKLAFEFLSKKPFQLIDTIKLKAQHENTIIEAELEKSRSRLFEIKEKELIERAKRDEEVLEIVDAKVKEKLSKEIESLRKQRSKLSSEIKESKTQEVPISDAAKELLIAAANSEDGTILLRVNHAHVGGMLYEVGDETLGDKYSTEFPKYKAALRELLENNYVIERGYKGEVFVLTGTGWNLSQVLRNESS